MKQSSEHAKDRSNKNYKTDKDNRKAIFTSAIMLSILVLIVIPVLAIPPLSTEFYGKVRTFNNNATSGTIEVYDSSGTLCGSFSIINEGAYGSLTCKGDDPETGVDEGAVLDENLTFLYNGAYTTMMGDYTWDQGIFKYVNITHPVVFCGDLFCDAWYETTYTCPQDCPDYNQTNTTINTTVNYTSNETDETGDETGGGTGGAAEGGESSTSGAISQAAYLNFLTNFSGPEGAEGFECKESWVCNNWSECRIDGFQNRNCTDKSACGSVEKKPLEVQKCTYTPTCSDGVRNGLEDGIDCGGLCTPCIGCFDGIQNCHDGKCEEDVDCGGPCLPCPTCFDGIKNCHEGLCEAGVDCGGPCEEKCPELQLPKPIFMCKKDINPLSNDSILFFIVILTVILGDIIRSHMKIKKIQDDKQLKDMERIKKIFSVRRKMLLFIVITILVALILYLYYYFFIMCETDYKYIWLLLILLFSMPIIIHELIRYMEYTEMKKLKKFEALLENHFKQIENLIRIENENLIELEEELANDLRDILARRSDEGEKSGEMVLVDEIYRKLVFVYSRYKEKNNPVEDEVILCDDIYKLLEDEKYERFIEENPDVAGIINRLKILYKQYEEKQKLYDELDKVDSSRETLGIDETDAEKEDKPSKQIVEEDKEEKEKDNL